MESINRPFENLALLLKVNPGIIRKNPPPAPKPSPVLPLKQNIDDDSLFFSAMNDVVPLKKNNIADFPCRKTVLAGECIKSASIRKYNDDTLETLKALDHLVNKGEGFDVSSTPEYIEGVGRGVHHGIAARLHKKDFAIQAHIDLHGMNSPDAMIAMDQFIKKSLSLGKKGLLIVHGRGLSSPEEPVLKTKVIERLTRGKWRRWVIAFCSAPLFDGGAGGTYILFRESPLPRRHLKGNPIKW